MTVRGPSIRGTLQPMAKRPSTLFMVVHLSSIDSFHMYLKELSGATVARAICRGLIAGLAQRAAEGPAMVLDQGWQGRWANEARRRLAQAAPHVIWTRHDEDTDGWDDLRQSLPRLLREQHATDIELGGFWLEGCVSEVERILKSAGLRVHVNQELSGSEARCGLSGPSPMGG